MAAGIHGSARTTPRVRAELQASQATTRGLAARYGLNPRTVAKWRSRSSTADARMGPARPRSTVLTEAEEAGDRRRVPPSHVATAGRYVGLLARDHSQALAQCPAPLPAAPRHLPTAPSEGVQAQALRRDQDRLRAHRRLRAALGAGQNLHVPSDRVSKFTHVAFLDANTKAHGATFLRQVVAAFPYRLHTVLTDNGMAFADLPKNRGRHREIEAVFGGHIFDRVCHEHGGIKHRHTKPYHPWTNGQAERMNRTVKEATIKAFHYPDLEALRAHVLAFVAAYNFAKHLKALRWRTPFQAICDAWKGDPSIFKIDPHHLIPGPHT